MDRDKDRFDELLSKALSQKMDDEHIPIPNVHHSWTDFERKWIQQRKPPQVMKRLGWVAVITMVILAASVVSQSTPVLSNIADMMDIPIISRSSPPKDEESNRSNTSGGRVFTHEKDVYDIEPQYVTLEEAKLFTTFTIRTPKFYDDEKYLLTEVMVYTNPQKSISHRVRLNYTYDDQWFAIVEEEIYDQDVAIGKHTEKVQLGNVEAVLNLQDGITELKWRMDGIAFTIYGTLTKDQMIAIAQRLIP